MGTRFYDFPDISNVKAFKATYRERLDSLGSADRAAGGAMSETIADEMVSEANFAFALNTAMFKELDEISGFKGTAAPHEALPESEGVVKKSPGCPFAGLGLPMPATHPTLARPSTETTSKCPLHQFKLLDVAVVVVLFALILMAMPSAESMDRLRGL